jgi:3alpha(or 20beta)-hydroxysteroid dehydrogenase
MHGYTATKWALRGLTRSCALELGGRSIRVNTICPGVVETPMTAGGDFSHYIGPLGRIGQPEEIANLMVYLASDESSYSTGADFVVDGGDLVGPRTR